MGVKLTDLVKGQEIELEALRGKVIALDAYNALYQFLAISTTLWIVKKAIVDDGRFTLDEGVSILLAHLLGVVLFDELSRLI